MTHRVFLFSARTPNRLIVETDCEIQVLEKCTWAKDRHGKRHLLGSTAFYTLVAASRAKRGALQRVVDNTALSRMHQTVNMWLNAKHQLERFDTTGQFPVTKRIH